MWIPHKQAARAACLYLERLYLEQLNAQLNAQSLARTTRVN